MGRTQNHRSKVKAGLSKRKPSKARRANRHTMAFWRRKALEAYEVRYKINKASKEVEEKEKEKEKEKKEKEKLATELEKVKRSIASLKRKHARDLNKMLTSARERWNREKHELTSRFEQTKSELLLEIERQEFAKLDAMEELEKLQRERGNSVNTEDYE